MIRSTLIDNFNLCLVISFYLAVDLSIYLFSIFLIYHSISLHLFIHLSNELFLFLSPSLNCVRPIVGNLCTSYRTPGGKNAKGFRTVIARSRNSFCGTICVLSFLSRCICMNEMPIYLFSSSKNLSTLGHAVIDFLILGHFSNANLSVHFGLSFFYCIHIVDFLIICHSTVMI